MSKFNTTKDTSPTQTNFMGEKSYELSDKEKLTSFVLTTFLTDSYYVTENDITSKIIDLVNKVGYNFAAKLALYARNTCNMRSVSHLLASLICKDETHPSWLKDFYENIIVRPDDMSEIISCYSELNDTDGKIRKIPNSMKKGFKKALEKLSPYQIDKYKMKNKNLSLVDLVNMFHPVPTKNNSEAYRRLINGESLRGTYESLILEKEMSESCNNSDMSEEDKNIAKHDAIKSVLESGMPIMNLIRNLRNIVLFAPDMIDEAISQLTNREKILKSKLLPFRFSSAFDTISNMTIADFSNKKEIDSKIKFESEKSEMTESRLEELKTKILNALEVAIQISCENVPELNGNCAILIDHSGSVRGDGGGYSKLSILSNQRTAMIGNLFGSILAYKQNNVYVGMFGDELIPCDINREKGLLDMNYRSYKEGEKCGGCTENGLYDFLKYVIKENKKIDNFIVFSDMEIGNKGEGGWDMTSRSDVSFAELFKQFRKINPDCLTVCCNIIAQSGTSVFNPNLKILNISGWSNSIFDTISMYQEGKIKSIVDQIEKIQV